MFQAMNRAFHNDSSAGVNAEILQIAATDGTDEFNVYVKPKNGIAPSASEVNKITYQYGILFYNNKPVESVNLQVALNSLLDWLKPKAPCLLIAHNAKQFDSKYLVTAAELCGVLNEFVNAVIGFSDTLHAFREKFPGRKSYSQTVLANDLQCICRCENTLSFNKVTKYQYYNQTQFYRWLVDGIYFISK